MRALLPLTASILLLSTSGALATSTSGSSGKGGSSGGGGGDVWDKINKATSYKGKMNAALELDKPKKKEIQNEGTGKMSSRAKKNSGQRA